MGGVSEMGRPYYEPRAYKPRPHLSGMRELDFAQFNIFYRGKHSENFHASHFEKYEPFDYLETFYETSY